MKKLFNYVIAVMAMFLVSQVASAITFNVTVPDGTNSCWVVGNFCKWDNNKHKMTKVDATHYTLTVAEADFADQTVTQATIKYKYLSGGGDWAYVEKDAAGAEIKDRDYSAADVVAKWALVWVDVPPLPKFVDVSVLVSDSVKQLYIVGNFNGWTIPTDTTMMTMVDHTAPNKIFNKKIWTADARKLQYKYVAGPAWDYEQTAGANFMLADPTQDAVSDVVKSFKAMFDPDKVGDIKITVTVPANTDSVWFQGSSVGWNWNKPASQLCTKNVDGTFTYTAKGVIGMQYRMYNKPDWDHPEVDSLGAERANRIAAYPADKDIKITVINWKKPIVNGINPLNKDKFTVYTKNNVVYVSGAKSQVELFNSAGQRIENQKATSSFTSKKLNSGMYILRIDGSTRKVVVK